MKLPRLPRFLARFTDPGITPLSPPPFGVEFQGAVANPGGVASFLAQIALGTASLGLSLNYATVANAAGVTYNQATVAPGIAGTVILRSGAAGVSDTTDTAQNITTNWTPLQVQNLAQPLLQLGQTSLFVIANTNSGTLTIVAGTNVTLAGTTTVVTVGLRFYQLKVTSVAQPNVACFNGNVLVPANPASTTTNTTTASAAVAASVPLITGPQPVVIPVASATGIIVGSTLSWVDTKGLNQCGVVSAVSGTNITVGNLGTNGIANGAAINVWNNTVTLTGMFAVGASITA